MAFGLTLIAIKLVHYLCSGCQVGRFGRLSQYRGLRWQFWRFYQILLPCGFMFNRFLSAVLLCLGPAAVAQAAITISVSDNADPGTTFNAGSVTTFTVFGNMMGGMKVTGTFLGDPNPHVAIWHSTGGQSGGADSDPNFSLIEV